MRILHNEKYKVPVSYQYFDEFKIRENQNQYKFFLYKKYRCNNFFNRCKENFLKLTEFKKTNDQALAVEDKILDNYMLNSDMRDDNYDFYLKYKFYKNSLDETQDYPGIYLQNINIFILETDEKIFKTPKQNVLHCLHIYENRLFHLKCKCKSGYFGVDCIHKFDIHHVSCEDLDMCRSNGICKKTSQKRECDCINGWGGKYCTKRITKNCKHELSTGNLKNSYFKIFVTVIILLVAVILILIGLIIYLLKKRI